MEPNYVAKKHVLSVFNFQRVIAYILIIPIFVLIYRCLEAKSYKIESYDEKIITYRGLLSKTKKQSVFMGVAATSVKQTLMGRICNYGNVSVDCVGKWDVDTYGIKDPYGLEAYLQSKIIKANTRTQIIHV